MTLPGLFKSCTSGNITTTIAVAIFPIAFAVGSALDYTQSFSAHTQIQEATDAAVLAAAAFDGSNSQKIAHGQKFFLSNISANITKYSPVISLVIDADGKVTGTTDGIYPTSFMKLAGVSELPVNTHAEANSSSLNNAEIVLVLDYSSSMTDQFEAMRDAAVSLINNITNNQTKTNIRFGLVPYASKVYASMDGRYVHGGVSGVAWTNCTIDRKWPWVIGDATPSSSMVSKWGLLDDDEYTDTEAAGYYDECTDYISNNLIVSPLSNNHSDTVSKLMAMTPHNDTNIALGMQFGWQVISPNAPWTQGVSYSNKTWSKYIILMSDGEHNRNGFGSGSTFSEEQGHANLQSVCAAAKTNDITIISIAYELNDEDAKTALRTCATRNNHYLEGTEENIAEVFEDIGTIISAGVYLSK